MPKYIVNLGENIDDGLTYCAVKLNVSRAEVIRRAITLLKHASNAKSISIIDQDNNERNILIK